MLPQTFATVRQDDRAVRRPMLTLAIAGFVGGVVIAATITMIREPQKMPQLSLCDSKYRQAARLGDDLLQLLPFGHESVYRTIISTILVSVGLASASCAVHELHGDVGTSRSGG